MRRIVQLGIIGCIAAVALVAHLWMFSTSDGSLRMLHDDMAALVAGPVAAASDAPLPGSCPTGMSACVAASAEELRPSLAVTISALPALLWALRHRSLTKRPRPRACRRGQPLSPVQEGVLLLE